MPLIKASKTTNICQACTNSTGFYERPVLNEVGASRSEFRTAAVRISENAPREFAASWQIDIAILCAFNSGIFSIFTSHVFCGSIEQTIFTEGIILELSDLDGKRVILKSLVRSAAGNYIGTKEDVGRILETGDNIYIRIDEGAEKGKIKEVPVDEIYVSEAEHSSYVLGGTGPWERSTDFVKVDDADYIIEWEYVRKDNIAFSRLHGSDPDIRKKKSVINELKKDADVFGIAEASRYLEAAEDDLKAQQQSVIPDLASVYRVMRFDSFKQYNGLTPVYHDNFFTEDQANEAMTESARSFVKHVKKNGFLIDIKRLSDNSVRIEYVDRTGGEAYVVFQVFEEKRKANAG